MADNLDYWQEYTLSWLQNIYVFSIPQNTWPTGNRNTSKEATFEQSTEQEDKEGRRQSNDHPEHQKVNRRNYGETFNAEMHSNRTVAVALEMPPGLEEEIL